MIEAERKALGALRFNTAPTPDDVWRPSPFHVEELHRTVVESIFDGVDLARSSDASSPLGVVIQGRSGSGKTHMLGMVRERALTDGAYFFLVSLLNGKAFWESTALSMVDGLLRPSIGWPTQLTAFLRRLTPMLGLPIEVRDAIAGSSNDLTPAHLDAFIVALRQLNRSVGQETQDTARALVLHGSADMKAQDVGYGYLNSQDAGDSTDRALWGLSAGSRSPQLIVRDMSRLFALTGPTVIAIDQIDTLFAQSRSSVLHDDDSIDREAAMLLGQVADGLMNLREVTHRTLTLVACLPDTWTLIKRGSATPVPARFRVTSTLNRIPDGNIGAAVVRKRFDERFSKIRFHPPYPTWPIAESAFADAPLFTPRALIRRVERHIQDCLHADEIVELTSLTTDPVTYGDGNATSEDTSGDLSELDARFEKLRSAADVEAATDPKTEDQAMPPLLAAGLAAWITEASADGNSYQQDPAPSARPVLHARLRRILDETIEDEMHWAFRGIASDHAGAVISRVRAACTMAALDVGVPKRRLVLLRNGSWTLGPKTNDVVEAFRAAGGETREISVDDLRTFAALRELAKEGHDEFGAWLRARKPASGTAVFAESLDQPAVVVELPETTPAQTTVVEPPIDFDSVGDAETSPDAVFVGSARVLDENRADESVVPLGVTIGDGAPFAVGLEALRKHTAIFAGSGSGKTVLIRRLVEECALQGVSAIVLDPNNDLGRLGDAWPEPPSGWAPGDAAKASDYLANTDVVVWTPRMKAGRPLSFQPLPNFAAILDDPDEFQAGVDIAVGALVPRAKVDGNTAKADLGQAVLRDALRFYARHGEGGMRAFIGILSALPDGVSLLTKGEKIAADMAETLTAAMVNDPLFGGDGAPVDPGVLLTPAPGKRARVSVISFIGLHSDEQRQGFVNQLQMALFAWIKRHPAGDRPLGGLFVMDEAQTLAPSSGRTACTASTLALVSQARKYGLGLVFATQAPRGLHNQIPGNSATQFFGLLNSPIQIAAAREMAQAKGGAVPDIGLLTTGQFYAAREGFAFQKVKAPLCLTHHPKAPLTPEEILERSAQG